MPNKSRRKLKLPRFRLFQRQEILLPTAQGWLILLILVVTLLFFGLTHIQTFLSVTDPIEAEALVVEGWMPDYAVKQALTEFEKGNYQVIITTGIPIERGEYLSEYKNFAELAAATLMQLGFAPEKVIAVATPDVTKDRTHAAALALKQWLSKTNFQFKSFKFKSFKLIAINLYTFDVHARRSWLLFKKALAPEVKVGVIAAEPIDYDPKHWWRYSTGVRKVIGESIAYVYAKVVGWNA